MRDRHQGNWSDPHSCLDLSEPRGNGLISCLARPPDFHYLSLPEREGWSPASSPADSPREVSNLYKNTAPGLCFPWEGGAGLGICIFQVSKRRSSVGSRSCSVERLGWRCQDFPRDLCSHTSYGSGGCERGESSRCPPSQQEPGVISPSSLNLANVCRCI